MRIETVEIFTHVDPRTTPPTVRHFDVDAMQRYIYGYILQRGALPEGVEIARVELDEALIANVKAFGGVEPEHVERIQRDADLLKAVLPAIACHMDDGTQLIVDGHHRLVALWYSDAREARMVFFRLGAWERFLVALPPEVERQFVADIKPTVPPELPHRWGEIYDGGM